MMTQSNLTVAVAVTVTVTAHTLLHNKHTIVQADEHGETLVTHLRGATGKDPFALAAQL
jgi:hypothetical protein